MKVVVLVVLNLLVQASSSVIKAPLDLITLEDLSPEDRKQLQFLEEHYDRPKRSGSGDILSSIKAAIGQSIKNKLALVAKSSASASGHFSSSLSAGHDHHEHHDHHYDIPHSYDQKSFDFWSLKKSILNTLLQAVKALKGGVIAIKGQLIKGSGHLISAKGKFISSKGEAITNLGKNIAASAVLSHGHHHEEHPHYDHHHVDVFHQAPSGPEYYHNSAPATHDDNDHHHDLDGHNAGGILILKKIPSKTSHSGPSLGTVFSKFFAASSSLNPQEPRPFDDTDLYEHHHEASEVVQSSHPHSLISGMVPLEPPEDTSTHAQDSQDYPHQNDFLPTPSTLKLTPPSTSYGTPIHPDEYDLSSLVVEPSGQASETLYEELLRKQKPVPSNSLLPDTKNFPSYLGELPAPFMKQLEDSKVLKATYKPFSGVPPTINQVPEPSLNLQPAYSITAQGQAPKSFRKPNHFDVVKSITYEIGPNGPKRLTRMVGRIL